MVVIPDDFNPAVLNEVEKYEEDQIDANIAAGKSIDIRYIVECVFLSCNMLTRMCSSTSWYRDSMGVHI
jgi:hypothetical protein